MKWPWTKRKENRAAEIEWFDKMKRAQLKIFNAAPEKRLDTIKAMQAAGEIDSYELDCVLLVARGKVGCNGYFCCDAKIPIEYALEELIKPSISSGATP